MKLKNQFPKLYDASLREFSSTSYDNASLNNILKEANLSKGSFYYNIGDKYTLYLMLMSCIACKKIEIWKNGQTEEYNLLNFYDKLRIICINNCNFIYSEPLLSKLYNQMFTEPPDFLEKIYTNFKPEEKTMWHQMINEAINCGDIRNDISIDIVYSFIDSSIKGLGSIINVLLDLEETKRKIHQYIDLIKAALTPDKEKL